MARVSTADLTVLKAKLRRLERQRKLIAIGLIVPSFLFLLVTFLIPIGVMLSRSVENPEVIEVLPGTVEAITRWDGKELPGEEVYAALAADMKRGKAERTIARVGRRLNYEIVGFRSLIKKSTRKVSKLKSGPYKQALIQIDGRWGEPMYWAAIKRNTFAYTGFYYLSALDLERNPEGTIVSAPANRSLYVEIALRTLWISLNVDVDLSGPRLPYGLSVRDPTEKKPATC